VLVGHVEAPILHRFEKSCSFIQWRFPWNNLKPPESTAHEKPADITETVYLETLPWGEGKAITADV
jgi:hypothetical protein